MKHLILFLTLSLIMVTGCQSTPEDAAGTQASADKAEAAASRAEAAADRIEKAAAQIAAASKPVAPSAAGIFETNTATAPAHACGSSCANPDCVYKGDKPTKSGGAEAGCPHAEAAAAQPTPEGGEHFGAAFTLAARVPLSQSLGEVTDTDSSPMQVTGKVAKVCKKKGCWLVLEEGGVTARVLMRGHGFGVPLDCDGKNAVVEGTVKARTFTTAQMKHLAEDGGEDPSKVSAPKKEYVLTATGVEIQG